MEGGGGRDEVGLTQRRQDRKEGKGEASCRLPPSSHFLRFVRFESFVVKKKDSPDAKRMKDWR